MKIEKIELSKLNLLKNNVRVHNDTQIKELMRSVETFGQTRALVIDETNTVLIGNGLLLALQRLEAKEADCYRVENLSEKDKKKLVLADNRTFQLGSDDYAAVQAFISDIAIDNDFDIPGFDPESIEALTRIPEQIEEDVQNYGIINNQDEAPSKDPAKPVEQEPYEEPEQKEQTEEESVPESAKVTCPHCGEVFEL